MKILSATVAMIIAVSSTAYAESKSGSPYWSREFTSLSPGRGAVESVVSSPNECAPDRAEPKWSATSSLLGYACSPFPAN
jgi:hypothetical protein